MTTLTAAAWMKISAAIGTVGIAAPALLWKTLPGEADLAKKYPADFTPQQVRERERNAIAMETYLNKLKEYSKDSRNIWIVMKEEQERSRREYARADAVRRDVAAQELAARRAEMKREVEAGQGRQ